MSGITANSSSNTEQDQAKRTWFRKLFEAQNAAYSPQKAGQPSIGWYFWSCKSPKPTPPNRSPHSTNKKQPQGKPNTTSTRGPTAAASPTATSPPTSATPPPTPSPSWTTAASTTPSPTRPRHPSAGWVRAPRARAGARPRRARGVAPRPRLLDPPLHRPRRRLRARRSRARRLV